MIHRTTLALCSACGRRVQARVVERDGAVLLEKWCPEHGPGTATIANDAGWYRRSLWCIKPNQPPLERSVDDFHGCPESCGYCPEHQQHACLPVVEITSACDLTCPVCLKRHPAVFQMTVGEFRGILERLRGCEGSIDVINLSGGEPTLHPDLEGLLVAAAEAGVTQVSVSTNGLRLLEQRSLRELLRRHGAVVALQFDGFSPEASVALRGEDLVARKLALVRTLEDEGVPFSLVATIQAGLNDTELPRIADFFFESGALTLMIQPVAYTGRGRSLPGPHVLLTTDAVVRGLAGGGFLKAEDVLPLPCAHPSCFAMAYYVRGGPGEFVPLRRFLGEEGFLSATANRALPGLDRAGWELVRERLCDLWSAADSSSRSEAVLARVRQALRELEGSGFTPRRALDLGMKSMKAVFIHAFMDRETFDFSRLVKCCNPYALADGRLVPMCAQNVFFQGDGVAATPPGES